MDETKLLRAINANQVAIMQLAQEVKELKQLLVEGAK